MKKTKTLIVAILLSASAFSQSKPEGHPIILEMADTLAANKNNKSVLIFTVVNSKDLGIPKEKVITLAQAWSSCKKIKDNKARNEQELEFLVTILSEKEQDKLISLMEKKQRDAKVQQD